MKIRSLILLLSVVVLCIAWKYDSYPKTTPSKDGLVKIMILYPNEEGKTFDLDYYSNNHMPMVEKLFGEPLKSYTIDQGISGRTPQEPATYVAIGTFYFERLQDYEIAFGNHAEKILGDIPNYTNIQPIVQISKVVR